MIGERDVRQDEAREERDHRVAHGVRPADLHEDEDHQRRQPDHRHDGQHVLRRDRRDVDVGVVPVEVAAASPGIHAAADPSTRSTCRSAGSGTCSKSCGQSSCPSCVPDRRAGTARAGSTCHCVGSSSARRSFRKTKLPDRLQHAFDRPAVERVACRRATSSASAVVSPELREAAGRPARGCCRPRGCSQVIQTRRPDEAEDRDADGVRRGEPAALALVVAVDVRDRHRGRRAASSGR